MLQNTTNGVLRALTDPRSVFNIDKGFVILVGFAREALIQVWKSPMVFLDTPAMGSIMADTEDDECPIGSALIAC